MVHQINQITHESKEHIIKYYTMEDAVILFELVEYNNWAQEKMMEQVSKRNK
jgi:hypothetical protein